MHASRRSPWSSYAQLELCSNQSAKFASDMLPSRKAAIFLVNSSRVSMAGSSISIIRKYTCEEHRCRIFNKLRLLQRADLGKLRWEFDPITAKKNPWTDHKGKLLTHNENGRIVNDQFPTGDPRRIAAKTHR